MPALQPLVLFAIATVRTTYVGAWSLYSLLINVAMVFGSLGLLVALIVNAALGNFRRRPKPATEEPQAPPVPSGPVFTLPGNEPESEAATPADRLVEYLPDETENEEAPAVPLVDPPARKTGLWQLLCAIFAGPAAVAVFQVVDNPAGTMQAVTPGFAITLVLLAAQIFFTAWFIRLQRKMPK